ncbi:coil containing protein [Vibrio phage 1.214.O._10N.222.54.F11]|nr:coil containing protein [Vibrio phage 1.214.O._10N.222.54.F11]
MKMKEHFPEAFQVDHNKSFEVQDAAWYSYGEKYESDGDQDSAIEHAVLNHDRMVEEIAELKGLVDNLKKDRSSAISLMSKSWQHGAEDRPMILTSFVEMANKQFESLAKLNQEGDL